jgi:PAS domain S-box-containing protein
MDGSTFLGENNLTDESQYKLLFESIPLPVWIFELSTFKFLEVNKASIDFYGYSREEFLSMTIKDIRPEDEIPFLEDVLSANTDNSFQTAGWKHVKKDGSVIYMEIFVNDIIYDDKKARLILAKDITHLKELDDALHLTSAIVESSEDAIISKTLDGLVTSWNEGAERMYGYSKTEILNKSISILIPPENKGEFEQIMNKIRNGDPIDHYRTVRIKKNGSRINVSVSIAPIKDKFKRIVGASTIARDITNLKIVEGERDKLLNNEIELRKKSEKIQEQLAFLSEASKILSSSLDYETILASIAGISVPFISDWCAIDLLNDDKKIERVAVVHSDAKKKNYADKLHDMFDDIPMESTNVYEVTRTGKSKYFPSISLDYYDDKNTNLELLSVLKNLGLSSLIIVPLKSRNKILGAISLVMKESNRLYDEDDLLFAEEIASRAAIAIDNVILYKESQSINAELEKRVRQRTEQLEAANYELETFSYSVSHDLKAPLRAIEGFTKILLEEHSINFNDEAKRMFNIVVANTSRMSQLIEDLLEFSRITRVQMNKINIDMMKLVENVFTDLKNLEKGRNINLSLDNLTSADGDPSMIRQVWINLISNAIKFTRPKDSAMIHIGNEITNDSKIYFIKDNGVGFDMKYSNNLFGVFQRLHKYKDFEGTGVGLALVERIIKRHGGKVWADAKLNEGASFYFTLES